jgi:protein ImuA
MSIVTFQPKLPPSGRHLPAAAGSLLSEVFSPDPADGAAAGFVLTQIGAGERPVLWVQDRLTRVEAGVPYLPGFGRPLLRVALSRPDEVLAAMEEGLGAQALAAVVGEIWGPAPAADFTATRRLALRAEAGGTSCWLIRRAAEPALSAARNRWRVSSLPSAAHPDDPLAPGAPRWRVELFRSRTALPGEWVACHDRTTNRVDFSAAFSDEPLAADPRPAGRAAGG